MTGRLQPLVDNQKIVTPDGRPTEYFIRWAQQRQIDIGAAITAEQALAIVEEFLADFLADNPLIEGSGIELTPSGNIADGVTISADVQAILDTITTDWGSILFRGTADWQALAPGTAGEFLKTNGAGADPEWAAAGGGGGGGGAAWTTLLSWSFAADGALAAPVITGIDADEIMVIMDGVQLQNPVGTPFNAALAVLVSINNGASFVAGPTDYQQVQINNAVITDGYIRASTTASTAARSMLAHIVNAKGTGPKAVFTNADPNMIVGAAGAINAIRLQARSTTLANFTAGRILVLGR